VEGKKFNLVEKQDFHSVQNFETQEGNPTQRKKKNEGDTAGNHKERKGKKKQDC